MVPTISGESKRQNQNYLDFLKTILSGPEPIHLKQPKLGKKKSISTKPKNQLLNYFQRRPTTSS